MILLWAITATALLVAVAVLFACAAYNCQAAERSATAWREAWGNRVDAVQSLNKDIAEANRLLKAMEAQRDEARAKWEDAAKARDEAQQRLKLFEDSLRSVVDVLYPKKTIKPGNPMAVLINECRAKSPGWARVNHQQGIDHG